MTIAKKALADYLNRKLDDFTFLKQWKRADLLEELRRLPVRPRITSPFKHWHHQLVSLLLCCLYDGFLLFLDVGSGKTRVLLETFAYRRRLGQVRKLFVVVLNDVNAYSWEDDAEVHAPQFDIRVLTGSRGKRWADFEDGGFDIHVISYAGFRTMLSKKVYDKKKKKMKMIFDLPMIKCLCRNVDMVVYDEIHLCKNHRSLTFTIGRRVSALLQYRYGATGTAFGREPEDLWAEFFLCDLGETLGTTLGLFREAFFNESKGFGGWKIWKFDKREKDTFRETLRHRSIHYRDSEIGDMPRRMNKVIRLRPPTELQTYYNTALESLQIATRNKELENNWVRLRMICSGFISYKNEDSEKIQIELPQNPKIDAVETFIEQVPLDRKGIIVHEFIYSGILIERKLEEMGIEFVCLNGRIKTAQKRKNYRQFREEEDPRFLIMNWKAAGAGGNYQVSPYMHLYETPVSPIQSKQVRGRIRRRDSLYKRVYYTDSIIKGSIEEDILKYLKEGRDLYADLMGSGKGRKRLKKLKGA
jgi:SNF2 family DNA or RNA helicase